jgi:glycosyltransferase involved in cell wall biosynthesis
MRTLSADANRESRILRSCAFEPRIAVCRGRWIIALAALLPQRGAAFIMRTQSGDGMRISVIVITYNWPQALDLVLRALARQSMQPDEVIVTDDGSRTDTRELLATAAKNYPTRLVHLWQPDDGARMSRARNRGIAAARGDYVVFLDGDMLAQRDFISDHAAFAQRGCFVQGSRVLTGERCAARLFAQQQIDLGFFARDIERRRHTLRMPALARAWARPHAREAGIKSCNWGFWREDLLALNGFNEAMTGWGREDNELALRAFHMGLQRRDLRFAGLATHLWHPTRKNVIDNPNDAVLAATRASAAVRCDMGLDQHLHEFATPPADLRAAS